MRCRILAVGKLKDAGLRSLCDDYRARIARYVEVEEREVKDDRALLRALPNSGRLVALEVLGASLSSQQFADHLIQWGSSGNGQVTFVIGGAEGLPPEIGRKADFQLSLSRMTLPHRLARLLLLEQVYRGLSIWRNEPYARED